MARRLKEMERDMGLQSFFGHKYATPLQKCELYPPMEGSVTGSSLASVLAISMITLAGMVLVSLGRSIFERAHSYLFALAAGALVANALLHMLPEAWQYLQSYSLTAGICVLGFVFLALLDVLKTEERLARLTRQNFFSPVIAFFVISDSVHNFFDGAIVALSYMADWQTGLYTSLAVGLHEIPLELVEWSLMLGMGMRLQRALLLNLFSALFSILGAAFCLVIGLESRTLVYYLLPFVAGGFFYLSFVKLLPRLSLAGRWAIPLHLLALLLGVLLMLDWLPHPG
jgi:zinc and cadmium transporter